MTVKEDREKKKSIKVFPAAFGKRMEAATLHVITLTQTAKLKEGRTLAS